MTLSHGAEPDDLPRGLGSDGGEPLTEEARLGLSKIVDHLVIDSLDELDQPHVVIVSSAWTTQFSGPFANAMAAACAAEAELELYVGAGPTEQVVVRLAPLLESRCPHGVQPPDQERS